MDKFFVILPIALVAIAVNLPVINSGVPLNRYENLMKGESPAEQGLYNASDKVISVTNESFEPLVLNQKYAILMEFYNSYCGHCRRFAPKYKDLAATIWPWRDFVKVMAIDCASDENNDICREYEVMVYPTIRFLHPQFEGAKDTIGDKIDTQDVDEIRSLLAEKCSRTNFTDSSWPSLAPLTKQSANEIFDSFPKDVQRVVAVFEKENSTLGIQMILHFSRYPGVRVVRVTDPDVAAKFGLDASKKISALDSNNNIENIPVSGELFSDLKNAIEQFLKAKGIKEKAEEVSEDWTPLSKSSLPGSSETATGTGGEEDQKIIEEVKRQKHAVYQADLEQALRYTIFHEIPKFTEISGERLLALQRFLGVVTLYNPLGSNGRDFVKKLHEFVVNHNQEIRGESFEQKAKELETQHSPIFSSSRYIGCSASKPGLRGFTCGLWTLFHFMTVQAAERESTTDPLEVMQAIYGYVKYFFGCSDCSNHFLTMASKRKIWNTTSKDEAVLWLWAAHNEVNNRLSGDDTEDPEFPKVQFPTKESCAECYREPNVSPVSGTVNWDKTEVLNFLKRIHCVENISRFGVEDESILSPTLEKLRQKRYLGNVFSDLDMRMGILLYGFCIVMMVIAVKFLLYKGYRKKPYHNDYLDKV